MTQGQPYHRRFGRDLHKMSKRFEKLQGGAKKEKCENSGKDGVPKRGGRRQTDPWELVSEHLNMFCDFIQGLSPDTCVHFLINQFKIIPFLGLPSHYEK